jgi:hypothetical protein
MFSSSTDKLDTSVGDVSVDMSVDYLVSIYLNKAGKVNAQFTRRLKVATQEVRDATLAKIKELGLREYNPQTLKAKPITRQKHLVVTPELIKMVLKEVEEEIIAIEKAVAERRKILEIVRKYYLRKLLEFPRAEKQVEKNGDYTYLDHLDLKSTAADMAETVQKLDDEIRGKSPCDTCFG